MPSRVFDASPYTPLLEKTTLPPAKRRRVIRPDIYNYLYEATPTSRCNSSSVCNEIVVVARISINQLPAEIIDHILSFVPRSVARTQCRLVCTIWNSILLSPLYWRDFAPPRSTGIDVDKYVEILSLPRFSQLHTLIFGWDHKVDDEVLRRLFERAPGLLSSLTTFEIQRCNGVSDCSMKLISKISNLQHLRLYNSSNWRGITDKGLEELVKLSSLRTLQLNYFKRISNDGLSSVGHLYSLRELILIGACQIADAGIKHLSSLGNLSSLAISLCGTLTDASLQTISASFPSLRTLSLGYNNPNSFFTDAGLLHLVSLVKLKELRLERTWGLLQGVGAKQLKEQLSELQIRQW